MEFNRWREAGGTHPGAAVSAAAQLIDFYEVKSNG
jgi:hypothetical protein